MADFHWRQCWRRSKTDQNVLDKIKFFVSQVCIEKVQLES